MSTEKINLDFHKILTLLPHRYPILLVDRVLELTPHQSIKALKNVSINEPYFQGHSPTRPVMPGVLILEALAQAAALLTFAEEKEPHDPETTLYYFVGIDKARFKRVVEPGDQLILNVNFERYMRGIWKFSARAEVDGAGGGAGRGGGGSRIDVHGENHGRRHEVMPAAPWARQTRADQATEHQARAHEQDSPYRDHRAGRAARRIRRSRSLRDRRPACTDWCAHDYWLAQRDRRPYSPRQRQPHRPLRIRRRPGAGNEKHR